VTFGESRLFSLSGLLRQLQAARRGVLRVAVADHAAPESWCTGWLITDRLVVIPRHVAAPELATSPEAFRCWAGNGTKAGEADLAYLPDQSQWGDVALLTLRKPRAGRALALALATPRPGDSALIPQFPYGQPELQLGMGRILPDDNQPMLRHDVPTYPASSGAPVLATESAAVTGMHLMQTAPDDDGSAGYAIRLADVLGTLRGSEAWAEIADHHRLADVRAVSSGLPVLGTAPQPSAAPELLAVALQWSVDPAGLSEAGREQLRPLVGDPDEPRWSLPGDERRRLIRQAGSLEVLREAAVGGQAGPDVAGQRAITRILAGPPFDLGEVSDGDLPAWLSAVGWFADVVPGLPAPADVLRDLERRRQRGRLATVAGSRLWGRESELARLRDWYHRGAGPLAVSGIGGMGKSALIARFALDLPLGTVLLWLDFDRADLAPDDAVSVVTALAEQLAVQIRGFTPPHFTAAALSLDLTELTAATEALGAALPGPGQAPVLVLDGFEIAQHAERHDEIWELLDRLLGLAPQLRVVVSGRAPVPGLRLGGRAARKLPLRPLPAATARAFLGSQGITDSRVASGIVRIASGVPLALKLAIRLAEAGGDIRSIPAGLPETLVESYLYQRILERVVDPALRRLAHDALQLRQLPPGIIPAVLADRIPAGVSEPEVAARLARELALVEQLGDADMPDEPLRLRPEVRAATLRLLDADDHERVAEIDRRAAAWYAGQDTADPAVAAELVYHLLRIGDVAGADRAWQDASEPFLRRAAQDIPDAARTARTWLRRRLREAADRRSALRRTAPAGTVEPPPPPYDLHWEDQAHDRIRDALQRGLVRPVVAILAERPERRAESPLTAYDAWVRWRVDGDVDSARQILAETGPASGRTGRQRAVLAARLAQMAGQRPAADALLAPLDGPGPWPKPDGPDEALAVRAARIRLAVDLPAELTLIRTLKGDDPSGILAASLPRAFGLGDIVLPALLRLMERAAPFGRYSSLPIPLVREDLPRFALRLDDARDASAMTGAAGPNIVSTALRERELPAAAWTRKDLGLEPDDLGYWPTDDTASGLGLELDLAVLARRRWEIAARTTFLGDVLGLADSKSPPLTDSLRLAAVCTIPVFCGQPMTFHGVTVDELLQRAAGNVSRSAASAGPTPLATLAQADRDALLDEQFNPLKLGSALFDTGLARFEARPWRNIPAERWLDGSASLLMYLLGPDPLDAVASRLLAIPDSIAGDL
jgi:hypothetical protein